MDLDFDKIFIIVVTALNASRAHPYIPRDKKWALQFFMMHGLYTFTFFIMFYNIICHGIKTNNFSQICKNGIMVVMYIVITFQYGILLKYQNLFVDIISDIKRDYDASKHFSSEERNVIYQYVNQGVWVCKQWLFVSGGGVCLFLFKSVIPMLYYYIISEFKLVAFYDMTYPIIIIEENKDNNIFVFLLTYVMTFEYSFYSGLIYLAYVPLGPIFILHACGQLELVKMKIDVLFVETDDEVIRTKLKNIIEHLQYIYRFVARLNEIFKLGYELTLKGTTLMLPITCYEVLEAFKRNEYNLEYFTFIIGSTLISSSPCYYSDLLMEKGEDVRLALYTSGWERYYDRRTRTTLVLMLQNALRPIAVQTIFTVLCLDTLTDLFQQSYALFNLMNAMWG